MMMMVMPPHSSAAPPAPLATTTTTTKNIITTTSTPDKYTRQIVQQQQQQQQQNMTGRRDSSRGSPRRGEGERAAEEKSTTSHHVVRHLPPPGAAPAAPAVGGDEDEDIDSSSSTICSVLVGVAQPQEEEEEEEEVAPQRLLETTQQKKIMIMTSAPGDDNFDVGRSSCPRRAGDTVSSSSKTTSLREAQAQLKTSAFLRVLEWEDLRRVSLLGRGTYADVYYMIETSSRQQFAVKYLNQKRWADEPKEKHDMAAADLVMEGTIMSHLDHPNILKLRGISSSLVNYSCTTSGATTTTTTTTTKFTTTRTSSSADDEEERTREETRPCSGAAVANSSSKKKSGGALARFSNRLDESERDTRSVVLGTTTITSPGVAAFGGFFLLFDILQETLKDRIARWRRQGVTTTLVPVVGASTAHTKNSSRRSYRRQRTSLEAYDGNSSGILLSAKTATSSTMMSEGAAPRNRKNNKQQQHRSFRRSFSTGDAQESLFRSTTNSKKIGRQGDEELLESTEESFSSSRRGERSVGGGGGWQLHSLHHSFARFRRSQQEQSSSSTSSTTRTITTGGSVIEDNEESVVRPKKERGPAADRKDDRHDPPPPSPYSRTRRAVVSSCQSSLHRVGVLWRQSSSDQITKQQQKVKELPVVDAEKMYDRIETTALDVASALNYLHRYSILFRDLKPANIGLNEMGIVQLFDFGLARHIDDCSKSELAGTPRYMAPEILKGEGYSFGSDIYSFGLLLYEICTLEAPEPPAPLLVVPPEVAVAAGRAETKSELLSRLVPLVAHTPEAAPTSTARRSTSSHSTTASTKGDRHHEEKATEDSSSSSRTTNKNHPRPPAADEEEDGAGHYLSRTPALHSIPCSITKGIIRDCLQVRPEDRPSMAVIEKSLRKRCWVASRR